MYIHIRCRIHGSVHTCTYIITCRKTKWLCLGRHVYIYVCTCTRVLTLSTYHEYICIHTHAYTFKKTVIRVYSIYTRVSLDVHICTSTYKQRTNCHEYLYIYICTYVISAYETKTTLMYICMCANSVTRIRTFNKDIHLHTYMYTCIQSFTCYQHAL